MPNNKNCNLRKTENANCNNKSYTDRSVYMNDVHDTRMHCQSEQKMCNCAILLQKKKMFVHLDSCLTCSRSNRPNKNVFKMQHTSAHTHKCGKQMRCKEHLSGAIKPTTIACIGQRWLLLFRSLFTYISFRLCIIY